MLYSKDELTEVHQGDARAILPTLPQGLIVTDPPFGIGYGYDVYKDEGGESYLGLLRETLRPPCVVIHYPEAMFRLATFLGPPTKCAAWVYHANTPRQWRMVAWFGIESDFGLGEQDYRNPSDRRIQKLINQGSRAALYDWWEVEQVKNVSADKTAHPCQMPFKVMQNILSVTSTDLPIIDPFAGSGTTLLAARSLGRKSYGIELSNDYCQIISDRLRGGIPDKPERKQLSLLT